MPPTRAFTPRFVVGNLLLSREGDVWQWLPDPQDDSRSSWVFYGAIEGIDAHTLPAKHLPGLSQLKAHHAANRIAGVPRGDELNLT